MFPTPMHHDQFGQLVRIQVDDMQHHLFYVSQKLMKLERAEIGKLEMKLGSSWQNWKIQLQLERTFKLEKLTLSWKSELMLAGNSPTSVTIF